MRSDTTKAGGATPGPWAVRPAWTRRADGAVRRCGWHLMCGSFLAQTFRLKRDAQAEADKRNAAATGEQQ